jgi:hypothetical protein
VNVEGIRNRAVRPSPFVVVDHGRAFAVVAHPQHQVPQPGAAPGGDVVAGVPQVTKVQTPMPIVRAASGQPDIATRSRRAIRPSAVVGSSLFVRG